MVTAYQYDMSFSEYLHVIVYTSSIQAYAAQLQIDTFQVTFDLDTVVSGITTKGRADAANWVTSFTLHYSTDGTVFHPIQEAGADVVSQ